MLFFQPMAASESEINFLRGKSIDFFNIAFQLHQQLGPDGKIVGNFNQFGEPSLRADYEAEEVFIKGCKEAGIPIVISSEEHGEVVLGMNPKYRGVLDGIDGTNAYKMGSGRYGTMFAIFKGVNPRYRDYVVAGILEYPSGRILLATKNGGTSLLDGTISYPVKTSGATILDQKQTRIFIDGGFEFNKQKFVGKFEGFRNVYIGNIDNKGIPWGASSIYYFDLATGEADVVLECTRKRNLEIAVAFGILNETETVIVDENGEDIGNREYLNYGQGPNEHLPIISAATKPLADEVVRLLES